MARHHARAAFTCFLFGAMILGPAVGCSGLSDDCHATKTCAVPPGECLAVVQNEPLLVCQVECPNKAATCDPDCTDYFRDSGATTCADLIALGSGGGAPRDAGSDSSADASADDASAVDGTGANPDGESEAGPNGIFVSARGRDDQKGTPDAPLRTIEAAIAAVKAGRANKIYVCNDVSAVARDAGEEVGPNDSGTSEAAASFIEAGSDALPDERADSASDAASLAPPGNLVIDGIALTELRGGYRCEGGQWVPPAPLDGGDAHTMIAPAEGVPLTIEHVGTPEAPLVVSGFEFRAPDAPEPGGSSIAAIVVDASVSFESVELEAGRGADAVSPPAPPSSGRSASAGNPAQGRSGGEPAGNECGLPSGNPQGGKGGDANNASSAYPTDGQQGQPTIISNSNAGGAGTYDSVSGKCSVGQTGASGPDGQDGSGATSWFDAADLEKGLWMPLAGAGGKDGSPGQGGGGGAGGLVVDTAQDAGGGGGGGAGGCGGAGGPGGPGGGSSIALLLVRSSASLSACVLAASDAGNGANGAEGAFGQSGGGSGQGQSPGCAGGAGGNGGKGGAGGGGAGGISAAVAYTKSPDGGADPIFYEVDGSAASSLSSGHAGAGGNSGDGGSSPASSADGGVNRAGVSGASGDRVLLE